MSSPKRNTRSSGPEKAKDTRGSVSEKQSSKENASSAAASSSAASSADDMPALDAPIAASSFYGSPSKSKSPSPHNRRSASIPPPVLSPVAGSRPVELTDDEEEEKDRSAAIAGSRKARGKRGEEEQRYEIARICQVMHTLSGTHYEVQWKGFKETTWEPEENLDFCKVLLAEFHKKETAKSKAVSTTPAKTKGKSNTKSKKKSSKDVEDEEEDEDEQVYEVESILAQRGSGRNARYLVKWVGFDDSSNTWEPFENISTCTAALNAFKKRQSKPAESGKKRKTASKSTTVSKKAKSNKGSKSRPGKAEAMDEDEEEEEVKDDDEKEDDGDDGDESDESDVYRVAKIIDKKYFGKTLKYLIQWEGFSAQDNTWEPLSNLVDCKHLLEQFERSRKDS